MIDLFGRILKEENGIALAGNNSYTVNLADVAKGVYIVVLEKGNTLVSTKIVIK
jgi:hypothetical protein